MYGVHRQSNHLLNRPTVARSELVELHHVPPPLLKAQETHSQTNQINDNCMLRSQYRRLCQDYNFYQYQSQLPLSSVARDYASGQEAINYSASNEFSPTRSVNTEGSYYNGEINDFNLPCNVPAETDAEADLLDAILQENDRRNFADIDKNGVFLPGNSASKSCHSQLLSQMFNDGVYDSHYKLNSDLNSSDLIVQRKVNSSSNNNNNVEYDTLGSKPHSCVNFVPSKSNHFGIEQYSVADGFPIPPAGIHQPPSSAFVEKEENSQVRFGNSTIDNVERRGLKELLLSNDDEDKNLSPSPLPPISLLSGKNCKPDHNSSGELLNQQNFYFSNDHHDFDKAESKKKRKKNEFNQHNEREMDSSDDTISNNCLYGQRKRSLSIPDSDDVFFKTIYSTQTNNAKPISTTESSNSNSAALKSVANTVVSGVSRKRRAQSSLVGSSGNAAVYDGGNAEIRNSKRLQSNERERMRMHQLNDAFQALRDICPHAKQERKLSKIETLTLAHNYIISLSRMVVALEKSVQLKTEMKTNRLESGVIQPINSPEKCDVLTDAIENSNEKDAKLNLKRDYQQP